MEQHMALCRLCEPPSFLSGVAVAYSPVRIQPNELEDYTIMNRFGAALAALTLTLAGTSQAAGPEEGEWYLSPMLTFIVGDKDRLVDDDLRGAQIGLGYAFDPNWMVEGFFQYNEFTGFQPADQWGLGVDLLRRFNSDGRFSPYLVAGAGWLRTNPDGAAERRNGAQFSTGVGMMLRGSDRVAVRGEYRLRGDATSPGLTDHLISLGFTFGFGAAAPPPAPAAAPEPAPAPPPPPPPPPPPAPERPCPEPRPGQPVDADGCALEIELPGVTFEFDSARLVGASERILNEAVEILQRHRNLRVEVQGHTDNVGRPSYNQDLSERRAQSVREYLISQGIAGDRLRARGYGEERPIASNDTAEGRARNRRVVLSFIVD